MKLEIDWTKLSENSFISHLDSIQLGHKLYLKKWTNCSSEKTELTFFFCHDFCHNHETFKDFIEWLLGHLKNIEIYTYDYIGHGLSSGTRGHFDDFDFLVEDTFKVINSIQLNGQTQFVGVGQGLGGLILLDLYNRLGNRLDLKISKLVLTSFVIDADKFPIKFNYATIQNNKFLSRLKFSEFYKAHELTHKPEKALYFAQDPLIIHRPTLGSIYEIKVKSKNIYQDAYFLDIPVFVGWSENDKYIYLPGMNYFLKGVKKNLLCEKRYSLMRHDLYNEIDSLTFYEDIRNWITENEKI